MILRKQLLPEVYFVPKMEANTTSDPQVGKRLFRETGHATRHGLDIHCFILATSLHHSEQDEIISVSLKCLSSVFLCTGSFVIIDWLYGSGVWH